MFHLPGPSQAPPGLIFFSSRNTVKLQLQWTHTLTLTMLRHQLPQNPATAMLLARVLAPVARPAATMVSEAPLSVASHQPQNDLHMLPLYVLVSLFLVFRPHLAKQAPNPSAVLGVFGLSIRTQERDLDEEFTRFGRVEKVTIVYDQRVCFNDCTREATNPKPRLLSPTALVASVSSKCRVWKRRHVASRN